MAQQRQLVLASTSIYRRDLLNRLKLVFVCVPPGIDEIPRAGESATDTALRLAEAKARAVAPGYPEALVIGSDQVAELAGERLEKPGAHAKAVEQLRKVSGRTVLFHTALCLYDARRNISRADVIASRVTYRPLSDTQIESYLQREPAYDCAGSAKAEGLGITLIARLETDDPTSLIGLPLIALTGLLAEAGLPVLG